MNRVKILGLALASLWWTLPASAQGEYDNRPYATVMYQFTYADDDRRSEDGHGVSFGIGKPIHRLWNLELTGYYSYFDTNGPNDQDWRDTGTRLDALFFYRRDLTFQPYFDIGVSAVHTDPRGFHPTSNDIAGHLGLGFLKTFNRYVGLRGDIGYRYVSVDDDVGGFDFGEPQARVGLYFPLNRPETPCCAAAVATAGPEKDSDGDGVPDSRDQCPGTPPGTRVDANGCPYATPVGPPTALGPCAEKKFEDVNFAFDKSNLTDYAKASLDKTASAIQGMSGTCRNVRVEVQGHTDAVGTDTYNQALGERRAGIVKDYLVRKGIAGGSITTRSYGEGKPVASNDNAKGRLLNRRSEIRAKSE